MLLAARTRSNQLVYSQLATEFQRERFRYITIKIWSSGFYENFTWHKYGQQRRWICQVNYKYFFLLTILILFGLSINRMDSKEKCEQIIQMFNGNPLPGSKEPLLVKFADSGQKKRNTSYRSDSRLWRESEVKIFIIKTHWSHIWTW